MTKPIIPWPGGKRRLVAPVISTFPEHRTYVEPFCGAAAIFLAKPPARVEVLNDFNGELTNLYRVIKHHPNELATQFRWALNSRRMFEWAQATPTEILTDIQRAARFFYLQKLTFGGKVTSQTFGYAPSSPPRLNLMRLEEDISELHLRLATVYIEDGCWQKCVARYDRAETLFFCDPPYWETAGYGTPFPWEQYIALEAFMRESQGTVVTTLNDHPAIRELFAGYDLAPIDIQYTAAGAHKAKPAKELIIRRKKPSQSKRKTVSK